MHACNIDTLNIRTGWQKTGPFLQAYNSCIRKAIYTVFKKTDVIHFAVTSSKLTNFETSFTLGNNNELSAK